MSLKNIRIITGLAVCTAVTLPFLDCTGRLVRYLCWAAKCQFLPALLSLSTFTWGALLMVLAVFAVTLLCGRVYCSVVCPLGVFQDAVAFLRRHFWPGFKGYGYAPSRTKVRLAFFAAAAAAGLLGLHFAYLAPYGIYSRAVATFGTPLARLANNALVPWLHAHGCWCVHAVEVAVPSVAVCVCAGATFLAVAGCAAARGRFWCGTVCPVGTLLGLVARFALFRPRIDAASCVKCGRCVKVCKAQCIDLEKGKVDMSRCVACFSCTAVCGKGAVGWK